MNDTQSKIGKLLQPGEERDAIHIAVLPVVASHDLTPGAPVGVLHVGGEATASATTFPRRGIVDPFLKEGVIHGERFWLFLYPNTVQDMRHHWKLEGIDEFTEAEKSKRWLENYAAAYGNDISYEELVSGLEGGEVFFGTDTSAPEEASHHRAELFAHLSMVKGKYFSQDHIANTIFRCAC